MKRIDLGQTIQIVANVGVIAGIVFLAVEIQQNTRSLEVNAYQEVIGQINDFAVIGMQEPTIPLLARTKTYFDDLTSEERVAVLGYFYLISRHADLAYYQYERGMLSRERLESAVGPLNDRVCLPLFREFWHQNSHNFVARYRDYIDLKIGDC